MAYPVSRSTKFSFSETPMSLLRRFFAGLRALFHKHSAEQDLSDELSGYLDSAVEDKMKSGLTRAAALRAARLEMGSLDGVKESVRAAGWENFLETLWQDLRFAARMLRKSPGFTTVAVLTLALGIGANTAIFTILNSAALRLLPVPHPDQLVTVGQEVRNIKGSLHRSVHDDDSFVSYSEYRLYARENRVFSGLLAYSAFTYTILEENKPQPIMGTLASCNYFNVLETRPARGRFFADSDCAAPGESAVVVLSDSAWRHTFAADPAIIGKAITLNRTSFRVIGIAPPGFDGTVPVASAFWAPLTMVKAFRPSSDFLGDDYLSWLAMIGRLKPGVSARQAEPELNVVASALNSLQPGRVTSVTLGRATLLGMPSLRTPMLIIGGLVMAALA